MIHVSQDWVSTLPILSSLLPKEIIPRKANREISLVHGRVKEPANHAAVPTAKLEKMKTNSTTTDSRQAATHQFSCH